MSPSMRSLDSDVSVKSALASASTAYGTEVLLSICQVPHTVIEYDFSSALREWDTMETCLTMMNDIQRTWNALFSFDFVFARSRNVPANGS